MARALKVFRENVRTIRRNEAELIRMHDSLEQRVEERTDELAEALQAANAANAAKSEFLATMSHELRTPLNAIIGFSNVILGKMFGPLGDPRYAEYAEDINDSGQHLLQHINDILGISEVEAGKTEIKEGYVDIPYALETCLTMVGERAKETGVKIECDAAPDLPTLFADERKFK